jgi:radical SAM protein with 4Fe4S-binding SPASM domain
MEQPPDESVTIMERDKGFLLFDPSVPKWKRVSPIVALCILLTQKGDNVMDQIDLYPGFSPDTLQDLINSALSSFKKERKDQEIHHPLDIEFNLTHTCSGECIYCYFTYTCDYVLNAFEWKSIIESAVHLHPDRIIFSGGDPLLYDGIYDVAQYAQEFSLKTHLLSNGLIPEEMIPDISTSFDSVQVSIDGFETTQSNLRRIPLHKVITSIKCLLDYGIPVTAGITLTSLNIDEILPLIEYLSTTGVDKFHISLFREIGKGKENPHLRAPPDAIVALFLKLFELEMNVDTLYHLLPIKSRKKYNCGTGKEIISIMPDGHVYPCNALIEPEFSCGSALKTNLEDIYLNSSVLHTLRNLTVEHFQPCNTCKYKYVCGGGCIGECFAHYEKIGVFQPECEFLKKFYQEFIWIT